MMHREKQQGFGGGGKPVAQGSSWLYGLLVGMTVSNLAAGAMMAGAMMAGPGAAISKAIAGKPLPAPGVRRG
jgi:hypothetical protein